MGLEGNSRRRVSNLGHWNLLDPLLGWDNWDGMFYCFCLHCSCFCLWLAKCVMQRAGMVMKCWGIYSFTRRDRTRMRPRMASIKI